MNAYYNRGFGKKSGVFVKKSSIKGTAFSKSRIAVSSISFIAAILGFIDYIVDFFCETHKRNLAKFVAGLTCFIGIIGMMAEKEFGGVCLLAGAFALALVGLIEFIIIRQR